MSGYAILVKTNDFQQNKRDNYEIFKLNHKPYNLKFKWELTV